MSTLGIHPYRTVHRAATRHRRAAHLLLALAVATAAGCARYRPQELSAAADLTNPSLNARRAARGVVGAQLW